MKDKLTRRGSMSNRSFMGRRCASPAAGMSAAGNRWVGGVRRGRSATRRSLLAVLVAAVSANGAAPALAADQSVGVGDNFFAPSRVAVKPGESVSWTNSGNHPHNVSFDDGTFTSPSPPSASAWTETRTFTADGAYRYYCQAHGSPGGVGMSGVVYVNAAGVPPPVAGFAISPNPAQVGQAVSFNGAGSSATEGSIVRYEWDLDGNGSYETDTGATASASRSYPAAQTLTIKLRVTDNQGASAETTRPLRINAPPSASLTASPNPAVTGQSVSFNGAGSTDPDGSIAKYEWDLDGDGSFETNTFNTPTTSRSYSSPGTLAVKLRVTDTNGATAETAMPLRIDPAAQLPPVLQPPVNSQPQPTPQPPRKGKPKQCSTLKGKKRSACTRRARCKKFKGAKRKACLKRGASRSRLHNLPPGPS